MDIFLFLDSNYELTIKEQYVLGQNASNFYRLVIASDIQLDNVDVILTLESSKKSVFASGIQHFLNGILEYTLPSNATKHCGELALQIMILQDTIKGFSTMCKCGIVVERTVNPEDSVSEEEKKGFIEESKLFLDQIREVCSETNMQLEQCERAIVEHKTEIDSRLVQTQESILSTVLYTLYPIGALYMSTSPNNPKSFIGGEWTTFGAGRAIVGVDMMQTEFDTVQKVGGEKKHKLTVNEMPSHGHGSKYYNPTVAQGDGWTWQLNSTGANGVDAFNILKAGGDQEHNNLQPYITVHMWQRIA